VSWYVGIIPEFNVPLLIYQVLFRTFTTFSRVAPPIMVGGCDILLEIYRFQGVVPAEVSTRVADNLFDAEIRVNS
jgi:hypothetical protein